MTRERLSCNIITTYPLPGIGISHIQGGNFKQPSRQVCVFSVLTCLDGYDFESGYTIL